MSYRTLQQLDNARVQLAFNPAAATMLGASTLRRIRGCRHRTDPSQSGLVSYCHSPYCPPCRRLKAEARARALRRGLHKVQSADARNKLLYATVTVPSCRTQDLRSVAQTLSTGWTNALDHPKVRHLIGWYRWLEVARDEQHRDLENLHMHGVLTLAPAYSGRNYLSANAWSDLWQSAVGTNTYYRSIDVSPVRSVDAVAGYISEESKFLADAQVAVEEPGRYIARTQQMYRIPKYASTGVLSGN